MKFKTFGFGNQEDYQKSNSIAEVPAKHFCHTYRTAIVNSVRDTAEHRQKLANDLSANFCETLGIPFIKVYVDEEKQWRRETARGTTKSKTLGKYWHSGNCGIKIVIRNLTAVKGKRVTNKVFLGTLEHELCHHCDCAKLGITSSPHTAGFYKRISDIDRKFGG